MATVNTPSTFRSELDPVTLETLRAFRRRRVVLLWLRAIGVAMLVFVSLTLLLATLDYLFFLNDGVRWAASILIYIATAMAMWWSGLGPARVHDEIQIARHVESVAPTLREDLVSAVELSDSSLDNGSPYFRKILQGRVARRIAKVDVGQLLPMRLIGRWLLSGLSVAAFCLALMLVPSAQFGRRLARAALPGIAIQRASQTKLTIIQPSPESGYVAQRDAVGVVVDVDGAAPDELLLQWESDDGNSGETVMMPRMDASLFQPGGDPSNESPRGEMPRRFAANLSVGSDPIRYRIRGGDAITLWHELTPLPRPHVTRYEKVYRLPEYAELSDRTADEEHGDLKALQGTSAEVTVTFDQPVEKPTVRFGVRGSKNQLQPVDDSGTRFLAKISIKTSGQYQINATSTRSGLDNPFSPTHLITPVIDTPPMVRWAPDVPPTQLVSALDIVELAALAADDLPLDQIVQEFQINGGPFETLPLAIDQGDRKYDLAWSWDLMKRTVDGDPSSQLNEGDLIRTRLLAIDRKGQRSESGVIEMLIAGEGFTSDRHEHLDALAEQTRDVVDWATQSGSLADGLNKLIKEDRLSDEATTTTNWKQLQRESVQLIRSVSQSLAGSANSADAAQADLIGRSLIDIETRLDDIIDQVRWLAEHDDPGWRKDRKRHLDAAGRSAKQLVYQAERLAEFTQSRFERALTAAVYSDAMQLRERVNKLANDPPDQRLARYLFLVAGQLAEVDRTIDRFQPILSDATDQHLSGDSWLRWSERWRLQLQALVAQKANRDQALAVLGSLQLQIQEQPQRVVFSGIHQASLRWGRDLRKEIRYLSDLAREVDQAGREWTTAKREAESERDAEEAAAEQTELRFRQLRLDNAIDRLVVRTGGQETLNRSKAKVDLEYAADQNLFLRAIQNVLKDGFQPYRNEPAEQVIDKLTQAICVLQAYSELDAVESSLLAIREGERLPDGSAVRKLYHPIWFDLQDSRIELAVRYLRQSGVDWQAVLEPIDQVRYNDDHQQAKTKIDSRQWRMDPFLSAGTSLELMAADLRTGLEKLSQRREQARATIRQYVLTLSEQAEQAAETAERAREETDKRDDETEETAEQLKPKQDEAIKQAAETIESLIDQANTSDIVDQEQREVARDADAAAEWVGQALRETREAVEQAGQAANESVRQEAMENAEEQLQTLSDRLQKTAEHFEKIESGEDVAETREALRRAEQEAKAAEKLDSRYNQAEQMADTANQDPRELLQRLEKELRRNETMQEALSDISKDLVSDASESLERASERERELAKRLESDDKAFAELKRQKQLLLDELINRADTIRDKTLETAKQAAGWANTPEAQAKIEAIRQRLKLATDQALDSVQNKPTLEEIKQATGQLQQQLERAASEVQSSAETFGENVDQPLHNDDRRRDRSASQMRSRSNQLRNQEMGAINRQRESWNRAGNESGRRVNSAEQAKRNAEKSIAQAESKLKKEPDNQWLKDEIKRQSDLHDESERAAEQARKTKQLAKDRLDQATQRANEMIQNKAPDLERPNPAAELGESVARDAAERLEQIAKEARSLSEQASDDSDLRATTESASDLSGEQEGVQRSVESAVEDLQRASRHEKRLEQEPLSNQLAQLADQTAERAEAAAENAAQKLEQTTQDGSQAPKAGQALREAADQIAEQADAIAESIRQTPESSTPDSDPENSQQSAGQQSAGQQSAGQQSGSQQPGSQPSASGAASKSTQQARRMAQTLDELDRSLAQQSRDSSNGQDEASESGASQQGPASSQQSSSSQQGQTQPGDGSDAGQERGQASNRSIDASPTLAQMLEAQRQQAARERMQSLMQSMGVPPSDAQNSQGQSPNPVSESGQGDPPAGSDDVDLMNEITNGDWGDLRTRRAEDAAQGRGLRLPQGYSREIQAYFKAISKRAAESSP